MRIAPREVTAIALAQHAHVAGDARGQHRGAAAHGFQDRVCTPFHAAGVHQHVCALDALACGGARQAAEPAVVRAVKRGLARGLAQRRLQRMADVVDADALVGAQQAGGLEQRLRPLFVAQMAHHHSAQVRPGLAQGP